MDIVKEYWNRQPCNINHSKKQINTKEYFDEVTKKRYFVEKHIIPFMELDTLNDKRVLEIGCGIGTDAFMLASYCKEYIGIDLTENAIQIVNERFKLYNLNGQFYSLNAEDLSIFEDNSIDMVYSFGVIHHTENPDKIVKEVNRVLKPGGIFKLMLYAKNSWKKIMIDEGLDQYEAQPNTPIAYTYTNKDVQKLLCDFNNINIEQTHIFPYKIPEYKNGEYVKEPWFEQMSDVVFETLKKRLGWHLCITCNK
jgi:ubiquinone/menaquinone biosynthesis C-methylase UbiE